jgi:hypothetical protein
MALPVNLQRRSCRATCRQWNCCDVCISASGRPPLQGKFTRARKHSHTNGHAQSCTRTPTHSRGHVFCLNGRTAGLPQGRQALPRRNPAGPLPSLALGACAGKRAHARTHTRTQTRSHTQASTLVAMKQMRCCGLMAASTAALPAFLKATRHFRAGSSPRPCHPLPSPHAQANAHMLGHARAHRHAHTHRHPHLLQ